MLVCVKNYVGSVAFLKPCSPLLAESDHICIPSFLFSPQTESAGPHSVRPGLRARVRADLLGRKLQRALGLERQPPSGLHCAAVPTGPLGGHGRLLFLLFPVHQQRTADGAAYDVLGSGLIYVWYE